MVGRTKLTAGKAGPITARHIGLVAAALLLALAFSAQDDAAAQSMTPAPVAQPSAAASDLSAQAQQPRRRPRIRVQPLPQIEQREPPFWLYPRPGTYSWPGPNGKRDCVAWYVLEHRPSGTVLTPREACRWVLG